MTDLVAPNKCDVIAPEKDYKGRLFTSFESEIAKEMMGLGYQSITRADIQAFWCKKLDIQSKY